MHLQAPSVPSKALQRGHRGVRFPPNEIGHQVIIEIGEKHIASGNPPCAKFAEIMG